METIDKDNKSNHVRSWKASGLSMREYCRKQGISYWSFREWRSIKPSRKKRTIVMAEIPSEIYRDTKVYLPIEIIINSRIRLSIREDFNRELLKNIVKTLEELS